MVVFALEPKMIEIIIIGSVGAACIAWVACLEYDFWEDE